MRSARRNIGERSENPSSWPAAGRPDERWRMETGGRGSTKSSSSSVQVVSHYRTPVGVIGTHIVSFGSVWGTVSDGSVRSFFVGKFLVEGPLLARHRTKSRRTITVIISGEVALRLMS